LQEALAEPLAVDSAALADEEAAHMEELCRLDQQETRILRRLYPLGFSPGGRGARLQQMGYRLRSLWHSLTGRNELLQGELQAVRAARLERMRNTDRLHRIQIAQLLEAHHTRLQLVNSLHESLGQQNEQLCRYYQEGLERRLKLLETLIDYDYR